MDDGDARAEPQLGRLPGEAEGAGDEGLARDDCGSGPECDESVGLPPHADHPVERVFDRFRLPHEERALAEVVQQERGQDRRVPGVADRVAAMEVSHVRVEGLAAGDAEDDRAHEEERDERVGFDEVEGVAGVDGVDHARVVKNLLEAQAGDADEVHRHDGAEDVSEFGGTFLLDCEECQKGDHREGDDDDLLVYLHTLGQDHEEAFVCREDGDGGSDDAVPVQEGGADHDGHCGRGDAFGLFSHVLREEREKHVDPAFSLLVLFHDEGDVFIRHNAEERPEDHREDPHDVCLGVPHFLYAFLHDVEGARTDVSEDDAQGAE